MTKISVGNHRYRRLFQCRTHKQAMEYLTVSREISSFYGTRRFFTMFTRACHCSLSSARSIQPTYFKINNIILPSTPRSSELDLKYTSFRPELWYAFLITLMISPYLPP
jgi:hypothetical protein